MRSLYEEFGLDPGLGATQITEVLKERIEDATDEKEKARLRTAWEELTLHPERRLLHAMLVPPTLPISSLSLRPESRPKPPDLYEPTPLDLVEYPRILPLLEADYGSPDTLVLDRDVDDDPALEEPL